MSTVLDFVRVAVAVAVGCGLYDFCMLTIVKLRHEQMSKAMAKEHAAIVARMYALRAQAEEATKEA